MDEGTLLEWLVKPGDVVAKGDLVAVVDTDKSAVDVECFTGGTVGQLLVQPGQRVPVGTVLATIESSGTPPATVPPAAEPAPAPGHPPAAPPVRHLAGVLGVDLATVRGTGRRGGVTRKDVERAAATGGPAALPRPRVSPYARRLAGELGVDLRTLPPGAGPVRADDERAAAATRTSRPQRAAGTGGAGADRQEAMRAAIARLMARSKREIPHYYLTTTIDLSATTRWLRDRNRELPVSERLVPAAALLKATALAARELPVLNGFWTEHGFVPGDDVHLGVAVSLRGGGLVAPALHHAADQSMEDLMRSLRDLVTRARAGRLRRDEMADPTLTVTNLGDQGVESVHGVIYPPQVALVGFGKVSDRPWAVDGLLGVRPVVTATLAADHRASDGYIGGRFLATIDRLLQAPEALR